ncbi:hypothetical protein [Arthrobacter sp. NicSoilB8]|uniref:hypothetical protein n=1 Tax=Arthrobacter sp. NicSoilB8 TaxID=2830998 RepID=UPI001CC65D4A|nr:hypothetical protein [Arthrobacter sp. NicSoilB8]BCW71669.1 hypothetical protein NicSoilB8_27130 [Arthrobacter sp. NicSoilB8]
MSQEQPPIRSRRELRQARDERLDTAGPGEPTEAEITGRNRRVADAPVDSVPGGAERSSQVRARDRAALRTIKELAEKEGHLAGGGPPTRRQLRLLQLATETAPATQANTIVPASPRTRANPVVPPARKDAAGKDAAANAAQKDTAQKDAAQKDTAQRNAAPTDSGPRAPMAPAADGVVPGGKAPAGMTVEQALAARELLAEQAKNQVAKMEHISATDPDAVDPAVLAEQIALAERAAILNRRAAAKQKLAEQNSQPAAPRNDPATANNLAMVTPLEFEKVPGVERPVMKRPATSYVPVVTNPGPRVDAPRKPGLRRPGLTRKGTAGPAAGRAGVLARAEAAAKAETARPVSAAAISAGEADENFVGGEPVAANSAYGLDPLDAATAGLGRARRLRMLQLGVLALGIVALIAGITLIVTGLAR